MDNNKKANFEKIFVIVVVLFVVFSAFFYIFAQYIGKGVGKALGESLTGPAQDLCDYTELGGAILNFLRKFSAR